MSDQDSSRSNSAASLDLLEVNRRYIAGVNHSMELGMEVIEASSEGIVVRMPYDEKIIGNPETGVIHGGALTSLLDQTLGSSVVCALYPDFDITPTIDLRIDHMRQPEPNKPIFAFASAYRVTRSVVFTRGVAYQESMENPISHCIGTFMRMGFQHKSGQWKRDGQAEQS